MRETLFYAANDMTETLEKRCIRCAALTPFSRRRAPYMRAIEKRVEAFYRLCAATKDGDTVDQEKQSLLVHDHATRESQRQYFICLYRDARQARGMRDTIASVPVNMKQRILPAMLALDVPTELLQLPVDNLHIPAAQSPIMLVERELPLPGYLRKIYCFDGICKRHLQTLAQTYKNVALVDATIK
ncbi:MAG: hypothetical protein AABY13_02800 [Nanoarchaeota archaeon]